MTMGTIDFITSSGRRTPMDAIPTPAFAVPYAAPKPDTHKLSKIEFFVTNQLNGA